MIPPTLVATPPSEQQHASRSRSAAPTRAWHAVATLLCAIAFAGNVSADTPAAAMFAGGNGTQGDPFQISNLAELRKFMETPVLGFFPPSAYYKLTANIDAADTSTWLGGSGWQPVDATLMDGFDPAGFEIQNLHINRPTEDGVGFFRSIGAFCCMTFDNFKLVGGQIAGQDNVGALAGSTGQGVTISNSLSTVNVSGRSTVGGLIGYMGTGSIASSSASGTVTGTGDIVGGLVGNVGGATVTSSQATGHVTGKKNVGGLAGVFTQGSGAGLTTCSASGQVNGDDLVGGLIGFSNGQVTFSYATGTVTATGINPTNVGYALTGGLIGQQSNGRPTQDSWASGAVTSPLSGVGGLIGSNGGAILRGAAIVGQVVVGGAAASAVGGLVGVNQGSITASRSASTINASGTGVDSIGGLVGSNAAGSGITTSYATGNVNAAGAVRVGGLVGWHTAGTISSSHAHGNVFGADNVGGLIGLSTNLPISISHASGSVSGASFVGGLIGNRGSGSTDTTFATGSVTGTGDYVGGLVGFNSGAVKKSYARLGTVSGATRVGGLVGLNQGTIETSYALKSVSGTSYIGGLAGQSQSNSFGVRDCYANGAVSGADKVGGLIGRNESLSNIARCYASGTVTPTGAGSLGGLVGDNQGASNTDDYWNADTATAAVAGVGTGIATNVNALTSVQMKQQASFTGFAFPSPWLITEGVTEPFLDWAAALATGLDVDSSAPQTKFAGPTDGLLVVRYLLGMTGNALVTGATGGTATRTDPAAVKAYLDALLPLLDVDGNGVADAVTDGLLIARYLLGLRGDALIAGAVDLPTATRQTAAQIESWIGMLLP